MSDISDQSKYYERMIDEIADAHIDQLKAENAKLFTLLKHESEQTEKLRELVRDAVILLDETCDTYFENEYHEIVNRMHELGVEVDA